MSKIYKCLISAVLLVAVVLSAVVPTYATDVDDSGSAGISSDSGVTGSDSGSGSISGDSGTTDSGSGSVSGDSDTTDSAVIAGVIGDVFKDLLKYCLTPVTVNGGEDEIIAARNYMNSVWRSGGPSQGNYVDVTYQTMSDMVAELNMRGIPCTMQLSRGSAAGYYIRGSGKAPLCDGVAYMDISGRWLSNTAGQYFRSQKESTSTPSKPSTVTPSTPSTGTTPGSPGYVSKPTSTDEIDLLQQLIQYTRFGNEFLSIADQWLGLLDRHVLNIQYYCANLVEIGNNTIQGMGSLIDTLELHLPDLKYIKDISNSSDSMVAQISRLNASFSSFFKQFNSVIANGELSIDTTPLEARLDKLISMYRKVNGVVLDTAAINGNQIVDAVGGELQNPMVYGNSYIANQKIYFAHGIGLTLNGVYTLTKFKDSSGNAVQLRSVPLGTSIPSYISSDPVLLAGVWKSGSNYIISDTLDLTTGIYTKRVQQLVFTGTESGYGFRTRANGSVLYYRTYTGDGQLAAFCNYGHFVPYEGAIKPGADASTSVDGTSYTYANGMLCITSTTLTDLTGWTNWIKSRRTAGASLAFFYVDGSSSTFKVTPKDTGIRELLTIPEGNSTISVSRGARLTAKYETYDSYTMQADIIAAINNLQLGGGGSGGDLSGVTSRLDTIINMMQIETDDLTCDHVYKQEMTQDVTCILPGLMVSTCTKCGSTNSEIIDPLGHDWKCTDHVDGGAALSATYDVGDDVSLLTATGYDVYTCSRCGDTYNDYDGEGAPENSKFSIAELIAKLFAKLGKLAGSLLSFIINLFDKALTSVDEIITKFNTYTAQITGFGGDYPAWLGGLWAIFPADLQVALTFAVVCMALAVVGKKLFFS